MGEKHMKINFPNTYQYFLKFKKDLEERSLYKLAGKDKIWYGLHVNIGDFTFAQYKVVWKYVAGKISGKAEFSTAVIEPSDNKYLGLRTIIPNEKLMLVPLTNRDEAYYVSANLNSSSTQLIAASYVIETAISTHVLEKLRIPKFDASNKHHLKLSELSKKAHELSKQIYEDGREDLRTNLAEVEEEIDQTVAELYELSETELKEIKKTLRILKEGEIEEEEEELEEEIALPSKKPIELRVEPLLIEEKQTMPIRVAIINNLDTTIKNVDVKVFLAGSVPPTEGVEQIKKGTPAVVTFTPPALDGGQYELLITMGYELKGKEEILEEKRTLFVKPKKKVKGESAIDKELDELLG